MFDYLGLDLGRSDAIAGSLDYVIRAALEKDVPVVVHVTEVAREAPFADELVAHRGGILPVLLHYDRAVAPNRDFAAFAILDGLAVLQDRDIVARVGLAERFEDRLFEG